MPSKVNKFVFFANFKFRYSFPDILAITILFLLIIVNFLIILKLRKDHAEQMAKKTEQPVDLAELSIAAAAAFGPVPDNGTNIVSKKLNLEQEKSLSRTKFFAPEMGNSDLTNPTNSASFVTLYNKSSELDLKKS